MDGWRILAYRDGVRLISRNGVEHTRRFRELAHAILKLPVQTFVLDGEVAVYDEKLGRFHLLGSFAAIASKRRMRSMIRVSVYYPNESGKKFDFDYYSKKHMKLVGDRLKVFGFARSEVDKGIAGGAPGAAPPYVCVGHVYVNSPRRARCGSHPPGASPP